MTNEHDRLSRAAESLAVIDRLRAAGVKANALPIFAYSADRGKMACMTPAKLTLLLDQLDIPHDRAKPEPQVSWRTPR